MFPEKKTSPSCSLISLYTKDHIAITDFALRNQGGAIGVVFNKGKIEESWLFDASTIFKILPSGQKIRVASESSSIFSFRPVSLHPILLAHLSSGFGYNEVIISGFRICALFYTENVKKRRNKKTDKFS